MMPKSYDLKSVEKKWQDKWENDKTFRFDNTSDRPIFSIDNPPRYASGGLHIGHATHYTHIDMIGRYRRLMGYNVFLPLCFDVNGMPIEVNVEKKYKVSPQNIPRSEFNALCSEFANKNIATMINQFKELGCSFDPSIYYQTDAEYYRRITQISFLKMLEKDMVYKGKHPVNWCTRCVTALGDAEIEYADRDTMLNFVKFYVEGNNVDETKEIRQDHRGHYVIVATTRPELLPTCQVVAVNPKDVRYASLVGRTLTTPIFRRKVRVISDEGVKPDYGTGIVMICSIGDKDDLEMIYKHDLDFEKAIDEEGKMTEQCALYEGMRTIEARAKIVQDLQDKDLLVKRETLPQSVGTCWRCHTPVEFLVKDQWFVKVMPYKKKIKEAAARLNWYPEWMKVRLDQWIDSLSWDWVISRQRYFATPIPVWECHECNKIVPATIDQCYVDPLNDDPPVAYCPECGGKLVGSKEVFDTWMDSSISALYNSYWYRDDTMFEKLYPMTVRTQAHDIIRTWAFYSLLRTVLLTEENPWQDIFVDGHILAPDGRSMHASWGNTIDPLEILEEYGSDPMRYFSASRGLGEDSAFSWKEITHSQRFINKIYNIGRFLENADAKGEVTMIDRWIASELALSIEKVEDAINKYQFSGALKEAERFIWHVFADNYLEMIKYRLYNDTLPADYVKGLYAAALKLIAPILVHVTEEVYSHLIGDGSIHTSEWPQVDLDEEALNKGRMANDIISEIRRWKSDAGLALNKELSSVTIYTEEDLDGLVDDIKGAMNIGEVTISAGQPDVKEVIVSVTPDFSLIGPTFGKDTKKVSTLLTDPDVASRLIEEGALEMEGFTLKKEYIAKVERAFEQKGKKVELIEHPSFIIEINE
jgi:valyl-tRNA synthetase